MKILWAVKIGDPDYMEVVITEEETKIPQAQEWAKKNGYDRFRIAEIDNEKPDFKKTISIKENRSSKKAKENGWDKVWKDAVNDPDFNDY